MRFSQRVWLHCASYWCLQHNKNPSITSVAYKANATTALEWYCVCKSGKQKNCRVLCFTYKIFFPLFNWKALTICHWIFLPVHCSCVSSKTFFFARFSKKTFHNSSQEEKKFFLLLIFPDFPIFCIGAWQRHQIR